MGSDETITHLSAEDDGFYITALTLDGSQVNVYKLPSDRVVSAGDRAGEKEEEEKDEKNLKATDTEVMETVFTRQSGVGSFFVDAVYANENIAVRSDTARSV